MNFWLRISGKTVLIMQTPKFREEHIRFLRGISRDWNSGSGFQGGSVMLFPAWCEGAPATRSLSGIPTPAQRHAACPPGGPWPLGSWTRSAWLQGLTLRCKGCVLCKSRHPCPVSRGTQQAPDHFARTQLKEHFCEVCPAPQRQRAGPPLVLHCTGSRVLP